MYDDRQYQQDQFFRRENEHDRERAALEIGVTVGAMSYAAQHASNPDVRWGLRASFALFFTFLTVGGLFNGGATDSSAWSIGLEVGCGLISLLLWGWVAEVKNEVAAEAAAAAAATAAAAAQRDAEQ